MSSGDPLYVALTERPLRRWLSRGGDLSVFTKPDGSIELLGYRKGLPPFSATVDPHGQVIRAAVLT